MGSNSIDVTEEIWKGIPGYEGLYQVSSLGRVRSLPRTSYRSDGARMTVKGGIRTTVRSGRGYQGVQLSDSEHKKKRHLVHRLVALAFLGPPPSSGSEVNHINLNKEDNTVGNLEWVSPEENMRHAYKNGRTDYRRPMRKDNHTGVKGVSPHDGGYQVNFCGKYVGWYKTLDEAVGRRREVEQQHENALL